MSVDIYIYIYVEICVYIYMYMFVDIYIYILDVFLQKSCIVGRIVFQVLFSYDEGWYLLDINWCNCHILTIDSYNHEPSSMIQE